MNHHWIKWGMIAATLWLAACSNTTTAPKTLFHWGNYQDVVYDGLEEKTSPDEQLQALQKITQLAPHGSIKVAPGVYAQLGMLYLKTGQRDQGIQALQQEKALYPESAHYMDYLIKQVKK